MRNLGFRQPFFSIAIIMFGGITYTVIMARSRKEYYYRTILQAFVFMALILETNRSQVPESRNPLERHYRLAQPMVWVLGFRV